MFESFRARHFGTELGTPKPAAFALDVATSVRSNTLFDPILRSSFRSTPWPWPRTIGCLWSRCGPMPRVAGPLSMTNPYRGFQSHSLRQ